MPAESNGPPLRVLRLAESASSAESLRQRLAQGIGVDMHVAATRGEFRELLAASEYDVVIAADALQVHREQLEELAESDRKSLELARDTLISVTGVVSRAIEIRDPYNAGHQRRVAALSVAIARQLGMTADEVEELALAAAIHDVGNISIPSDVLGKPAKLSSTEFELVKTHPQAGYDIISSAGLTGAVPELVLQHHERCDGSGYPRGLLAEQLLPGAKILMVCDVVEAMSSRRPYRTALGIGAARKEIVAGSGVKFDVNAVKTCLDVLDAGFVFEDVQV